MDGDRPPTKEVSRKIRLFPAQKEKWFQLLHASRRAYNLCVAAFRAWKKDEPGATGNQVTFRASVREVVRKEFPEVPSVLLDEAVNSAYLTRKSVLKRRKQGEKCDFSFRSRKDMKQSFVIQRLAGSGPFPSTLSQHLTEAIPSEAVGKMASVVWECGRWFLICKVRVAISAESQGRAMVACDPGVRTFLTAYSPTDCAKIGKGFAARLRPMLQRLDKLFGQRAKFLKAAPTTWKQCHRDRFRYFQRRIFSIRNKIQDLIHDLHKRAADFLTANYDVILLPTFETSRMVTKTSRKITSRTVRQMLSLGHYRFRQYLEWIAYKRGKRVVTCSEAYTSRTDSRTGEIVEIGASETINGLDRDVNGARGIFLRALVT
jgi:putative transposase